MMPINNDNASYSALQIGTHPTMNISHSGRVSQTTTAPRDKDQYYAIWSAWEKNAPQGGGDLRDIAVERMRNYLRRNGDSLDLSRLSLCSLPDAIPEQIRELDGFVE